jgi:hypothetical protein
MNSSSLLNMNSPELLEYILQDMTTKAGVYDGLQSATYMILAIPVYKSVYVEEIDKPMVAALKQIPITRAELKLALNNLLHSREATLSVKEKALQAFLAADLAPELAFKIINQSHQHDDCADIPKRISAIQKTLRTIMAKLSDLGIDLDTTTYYILTSLKKNKSITPALSEAKYDQLDTNLKMLLKGIVTPHQFIAGLMTANNIGDAAQIQLDRQDDLASETISHVVQEHITLEHEPQDTIYATSTTMMVQKKLALINRGIFHDGQFSGASLQALAKTESSCIKHSNQLLSGNTVNQNTTASYPSYTSMVVLSIATGTVANLIFHAARDFFGFFPGAKFKSLKVTADNELALGVDRGNKYV